MNWSITFAPLLPTPVLIGLTVLAVALILVMLFRRSRGAIIRAAALAALLGALFNPILKEEQRESLANVAIVVLDESPSQKLADRSRQMEAIRLRRAFRRSLAMPQRSKRGRPDRGAIALLPRSP